MPELKLGLQLGYWGATPPTGLVPLVQQAERLGFDSVWTAEAYGSDALTPLAWVGANTTRIRLGTGICQLSARTPTAAAMAAMTLDHLSGGRMILGLGVSGPQVVEGWYGAPFAQPLARTREYIDIVRRVLRREAPVANAGPHYPLPYDGEGAWGLGKPLKSIVHPLRADLPIYLAATGTRNVALAAEIADGWMPIFYAPSHGDVFEAAIAGGRAASGRPSFTVAPMVPVAAGEDLDACRARIRSYLALYLGGMGSKADNFYANLVRRYGYEEVDVIQERFLAGEREAAAAAVPETLLDELALVGPAGRIRERLIAWEAAGVDTMICLTQDPAEMAILAEAFDR
jgi:F420-dependent oxidoreductase-like protein